jgi:hypothetical protein
VVTWNLWERGSGRGLAKSEEKRARVRLAEVRTRDLLEVSWRVFLTGDMNGKGMGIGDYGFTSAVGRRSAMVAVVVELR